MAKLQKSESAVKAKVSGPRRKRKRMREVKDRSQYAPTSKACAVAMGMHEYLKPR